MTESAYGFRLQISAGAAEPPVMDVAPGQTLGPFSVGTAGSWRVDGPGVRDEHAFVYFDGTTLFVQSVNGGTPAFIDGAPVPLDWTAVLPSSVIALGEAAFWFGEADGSTSDEQPPPSASTALIALPPQSAPAPPAPPPRPERPLMRVAIEEDPTGATKMAPIEDMLAQVQARRAAQPLTSGATVLMPATNVDVNALPPSPHAQPQHAGPIFLGAVAQPAAPGSRPPPRMSSQPPPYDAPPPLGSQPPPPMGSYPPPAMPAQPSFGSQPPPPMGSQPPPPMGSQPPPPMGSHPPSPMGSQPPPRMPMGSQPPGPMGSQPPGPIGPAPTFGPPPSVPAPNAGGGGIAGFWRNAPPARKVIIVLLPAVLASVFVLFGYSPTDPSPNLPTSQPSAVMTAPTTTATTTAMTDPGVPPIAETGGPVMGKPAPVIEPLGSASASPSTKTLERAAADAVAAGAYGEAASIYQRLAREHPENPAFKEAARIMAIKAAQNR